jgi:hypothetical protein
MDPAAPTHESVRLELQNILGSSAFATAARSRRFLSWVTEKTLAGEADEIKEFTVGVEVFDRADDFDPKVDTIVRVEAGKLRKRLDQYYENEGANAPVRITMTKGGYVPGFERRAAVPAPARTPFAWWKYAVAVGFLILSIGRGAHLLACGNARGRTLRSSSAVSELQFRPCQRIFRRRTHRRPDRRPVAPGWTAGRFAHVGVHV